ncbi:DUF6053 domain-containing protein [Lysobacter enzymogenes]|uniref:DUF6053 domain-containing protein n=1 Tax=Lysobacter enzymogenes TaxID=69 RepID=UPI003D189B3D
MGGTSVPMLCAQVAATRHKSVGTEVPPTRVAFLRGARPGSATVRLIAASINRCRLAAASRTRSNSTSATGVENFDAIRVNPIQPRALAPAEPTVPNS